jgi:hypothetical protein
MYSIETYAIAFCAMTIVRRSSPRRRPVAVGHRVGLDHESTDLWERSRTAADRSVIART